MANKYVVIPPYIKRLCKGYVAELCPPSPCPAVPPPLPTVVKKPPISSTFDFFWMDEYVYKDYSLDDPKGFLMTNMALQKAIGVHTVFMQHRPGSLYTDILVKAARAYGMKIIISTPTARMVGLDNWLDETTKNAGLALGYDPDGWYLDWEMDISYPYYVDQNGIWTNQASYYPPVINFLNDLSRIPIWVSPFYGVYGTIPPDNIVTTYWEEFVSRVSKDLKPGIKMFSALQDGCGCDYTVPWRVHGSEAYQDMLGKLKIHKQVCEKYGWGTTVNCELFGHDNNLATPERIKAQITEEGKSDYVSEGMELGPCFDAVCFTYQMKGHSRENPSGVYKMLWNMYNGE